MNEYGKGLFGFVAIIVGFASFLFMLAGVALGITGLVVHQVVLTTVGWTFSAISCFMLSISCCVLIRSFPKGMFS
ncbi:MAG: hypothetical protein P4L69_05155 [Desulfosporosinus sp.]|nr:hypothetical protein [Desulfosporosinus sp.]